MALIAKYSLNGNANDLVGSNNGTATNITWVDGKMNQGASFNGTNSIIRSNFGDIFGSNVLSYSCLAFIRSLPTYTGTADNIGYRILSVEENTEKAIYDKAIIINKDGNIRSYVFDGAVKNTNSTNTITLNKWQLYTFVFDGNNLYFYLDKKLNGSIIASGTYNFSNPIFAIGGYSDTNSTDYIDGIIDEVNIYNHALTVAEIQNQYLYYNGFYS